MRRLHASDLLIYLFICWRFRLICLMLRARQFDSVFLLPLVLCLKVVTHLVKIIWSVVGYSSRQHSTVEQKIVRNIFLEAFQAPQSSSHRQNHSNVKVAMAIPVRSSLIKIYGSLRGLQIAAFGTLDLKLPSILVMTSTNRPYE